MVGFPSDSGDNLCVPDAFKNLKNHSKEVALAIFWLAISGNSVLAKDIAPSPGQREAKGAISSALGPNKGVAGFLAGMVYFGLVASFTGPGAMFVAGAFCAGRFSY